MANQDGQEAKHPEVDQAPFVQAGRLGTPGVRCNLVKKCVSLFLEAIGTQGWPGRGTQGKAREGIPKAPWGPPGFPLDAPDLPPNTN
jgi:hypothetical protein